MSKVKRLVRLINKVFSGVNPFYVDRPQQDWDRQYQKGYWNFLIQDESDHANTIAIARFIASEFGDQGSVRILDVGCGNGSLLKHLRHEKIVVDYTGTDISQTALDSISAWDKEAELIRCDALAFTSAGGPYDCIVFNEILNYVPFWKVVKHYKTFAHKQSVVIISMYRAWRSKVIWFIIHLWLRTVRTFAIARGEEEKYWTVKVCKYK